MPVARDVMTTKVLTATPGTSVPEIAQLLLRHRVSGAPVVDPEGRVVGMVSEGDLMRRPEAGTESRRGSWWLTLFKGPEDLAREFIKTRGWRTGDVMTREVVTVTEDTPVAAVAQLLEERRIKRVPVVREGRLVGIVSRADLLRAVAASQAEPPRASTADDRAIREHLLATMTSAPWATPAYLNVIVSDGVVHLWGLVRSPDERRALRVAAEQVPGVRAVEDHLVDAQIWSSAE